MHRMSDRGRRGLGPLTAGCVVAVLLLFAAAAGARSTTLVQVTGTTSHPVPPGFLGLSMSTTEMDNYASQPALARMLQVIHPYGGPFSLRIGGQTADRTVWAGAQRLIAPRYRFPGPYVVGPAWMDELHGLAARTDSHVILDVSTADHSPGADRALTAAARRALGARLTAVAVGNEPDLYGMGLVGDDRDPGAWAYRYDPRSYAHEFAQLAPAVRSAGPGLSLLGPETAYPSPRWSQALLDAHVPLGEVTVHTYPMLGCLKPGSFRYPTVAGFLADHTLNFWTHKDAHIEMLAAEHGLPLRISELGAAACHGIPGVTNGEATALWVVNQLFALATDGIAGVNVHVRATGISSALDAPAGGQLQPQPLFYGMALFARAVGPHARILTETSEPVDQLHVWTTASTLGLRTVIVNTGPRRRRVTLAAPAHGAATVQALTAPTPRSTQIALGGQTLSSAGTWRGSPKTTTAADRQGTWTVTVPADSAELVALRASGG
jgi:Glycosyl hydrolase family 79 C-terminal beta domain